jgi:hypothetical protein
MLPRLGRAAALAGLLVLPVPAWAANPLATEESQTLDVGRLSPEQRRRLLAGDTIAYQVLETGETEIGAGVAMYLAVPLARAAEVLTSPDVVLKDPSITAWGLIPAHATAAAFQGFKLAGGEQGEARETLEAEADLRFNLTLAESETFRAARAAPGCCDRAGTIETATAQWRMLLLRRAEAFQSRGLDGVAPYARRGGISDPAALLRVAAGDARVVAPFAPRLGEALLRYPADQSPTSISQLYWVKRQVQGRPTPILLHHLVEVTPALALYVERQFYVGHTYNASQILCAAVPYEDGVVILSSNRVSTDQVGGFGGDMKRMIGRRQLRAEIVKRFDRIRAALARPTRPPEPVESP